MRPVSSAFSSFLSKNSTTALSHSVCSDTALRSFSSKPSIASSKPEPLILWVVNGEDYDEEEEEETSSSSSSDSSEDSEDDDDDSPLVLLPPTLINTQLVDSVEGVVYAVNQYYGANQEHFVGGMGENDPGVWFAPLDQDLLVSSLDLLRDSMEACRQQRHGVPFSVYTTGVNVDAAAVAALKWDSVQVSLWAASPADYQASTGRDDFGAVCGFIAEASDLGVPVEVGVLKQYAGAARDLATSLGARQVHVYSYEEQE